MPLEPREPRRVRGTSRRENSGPKVLLIVMSVIGGVFLVSCLGVVGCVVIVGRGVQNVAKEVEQEAERSKQKMLEEKKTPLSVPLAELLADYKANEVAADAKYKGKWLKLAGRVQRIAKTGLTDSIYVTMTATGSSTTGLTAWFGDESANRVAKLRAGMTITFTGKCNGLSLGDVQIRECELVGEPIDSPKESGPSTHMPRESNPSTPKPSKPVPIDWATVGNKVRIGDVSFELLWARHPYVFVGQSGESRDYGNLMTLAFKITNHSPGKIVRFQGWHQNHPEKLTASDEFGNGYERLIIRGPFAVEPRSDDRVDDAPLAGADYSAIAMGTDFSLHPGKYYATYVFFEKATDKATEVRFIIRGESVGLSGEFPVRQRIKRNIQGR
jgi:hypothetical protein